MENYTIKEVHISEIKAGDTILHFDGLRTVCKSNIKTGGFHGRTLFGDSYNSGTILVKQVTFNNQNHENEPIKK